MKTLYQYILEVSKQGQSKTLKKATYDDLVGIKDIYDYTYDENKPEEVEQKKNILFIIKKIQPNLLCIRNASKADGINHLCKVFGLKKENISVNDSNNGTIVPTQTLEGSYIKIHITDKTIGPKIETRDQETATCIVYNYVVDTYNDEMYSKGLDKDEIIKMLVNTLNVNFDKTGWYETFALQVDKIIKALGGIEKAKDYRMERFGGNPKYTPADWSLREPYEEMILRYTKLMGGKKDNWDPSDVIIYNVNQRDNLINTFNSLTNQIKTAINTDDDKIKLPIIENVINTLRDLYKKEDKPFMGISLKKLGNSASLEQYNMSEGDRLKITQDPSTIEVMTRKGGVGAYTVLGGQYKFEDIITPDGNLENIKAHKIKLELRTFGKGINALDVTLESGPSVGKCPVNVWTKLFGVSSTAPIQDCVEAFKKFMENPKLDDINKLVQAAAKNGPHCLPFVLIH